MSELEKQKAHALRYRKPVVKGLSIEEIQNELFSIIDDCSEIIWEWNSDKDTIIDALCGDEDDAGEMMLQFSDLQSNTEDMLDDLKNCYISEHFDDFFAGTIGQGMDMYGYDTYEQDYFPIDRWESRYAASEARKRMERLTKSELLEAAGACMSLYSSFISLQTRHLSLKAALDILSGNNTKVLSTVRTINEIYDEYAKNDYPEWSKEARDIDRLGGLLSPEAWLQ